MADLEQLTHRVDQLEAALRAVYPELQRLRAEVATLASQSVAPVPAPSAAVTPGATHPSTAPAAGEAPGPSPGWPESRTPRALGAELDRRPPAATIDLEALVGRYGALALATVTILLGVGAFVRWAIARGFLGPVVRVGLGLAAAALVAAVGIWLRDRGSRGFGHTLLALALAIVHVDAWGAGPVLHLVASPVALGGAALASAALAWLALVDGEPTVFSVGVGGALLAPFVTASDEPHVVPLLAFGYVVIAVTIWAIRDRGWDLPVMLLAVGVALYTAASAAAPVQQWSGFAASAGAAFSIGCAATAIAALAPRYRAMLGQASLVAAWGALTWLASHGAPASHVVAGAAVATLVAYATVSTLGEAPFRVFAGAGALPVALAGVAVWAMPPVPLERATVVAAWGVAAAAMATAFDRAYARIHQAATPPGPVPEPSGWSEKTGSAFAAVTAVAFGAVAIALALEGRDPVYGICALALYATLVALIASRRGWVHVWLTAMVTLGIATLWSWELIGRGAPFKDLPFVGRSSMAAALAVAGWLAIAEALARAPGRAPAGGGPDPAVSWDSLSEGRLPRLIAAAVAFWWVRLELAHTNSAEVSVFLLIAYYAAAGVAAVFVGRVKRIPPLRNAGLAVAGYAAIKAVAEASRLGIALRIASYLSVGLFLLAVAYWYRGRSDAEAGAGRQES